MAGHVAKTATKYEYPKPIRSWVMSYNVSRWLPLKMRTQPQRMRQITWPVSRGSKTITFFGIPDPDLPIHYRTSIGLRRRLRVAYSRASPMLKPLIVYFFCAWPCDLDLWPFNLEQLFYIAGHMVIHATKFEDRTTIRSRVTSYNGSSWLPLKMRTRPLHKRRITWPVNRGSETITYLQSATPICLFTIQLIRLWRRLRVVYSRASNVEAVFWRKKF